MIEGVILSWYAASCAVVMLTMWAVYVELTSHEKVALAQIAQLKAHIGGLERANEMYQRAIGEIVGDPTEIELSPKLIALLKEALSMVKEEQKK